MPRNFTSPPPPEPPVYLSVHSSEATRLIDARVEIGRALINRQIHDERSLKQIQGEY